MRTCKMLGRILLFTLLGAAVTTLPVLAANTNPNHDSAQAQDGDCTYCHVSANTGPTLPKQAACLYCHVRWNPATTTLEVFGLQQEYGLPPTELLKHEIFSNSGQEIQIYDFAACFACHSDAAIAPAVSPYHGAKVNGLTWTDNLEDPNDDAYAMFYYHPGRNTFNAMSYVFNNRNGSFNHRLVLGYISMVNCAGQTAEDLGRNANNLCVPVPRYRGLEGDTWELPEPGFELRVTIPFDNFGADPSPTYIDVPYFPEIPPPGTSPCPDTDQDGWAVCDASCDSTGLNCGDVCPDDPGKTADPGQCGCGVAETDTDMDGMADCLDVCPTDPDKSVDAGQCGCGVAETDTDSDGIADCVDVCPNDPNNNCQATSCTDYTDKATCIADMACEWIGNAKNGFCQDAAPAEICDDTIDNDGDGQVDCDDSDCAGVGSCPAQATCSDYNGDEASCLAAGCSWNSGKQTCR